MTAAKKWALSQDYQVVTDNQLMQYLPIIDPKDEEFKDIMKIARTKLEIPMPAVMSCIGKHKTKYASIVEADESMRIRLEEFTKSLQFGAQVHSDAPSNENTGCKGSSGQRMEKLEEKLAWQTKVRNKNVVVADARNEGRKVHFASLVEFCHLKNSELEPRHQKYKGRVVLLRDIVKDDSGSYAVFTEQGSSASQMTAAKVMDIMSRLAGCAGRAADAVSAYTQVKMEDDPQLLKIPKSECPDIWIRLPRHKWPKSWSSIQDPVVPLERNLYGHPLAGPLWERQFEKILLKYGWEKVFNWECLFVHREKGLFLSVYVDDIKLAGNKQNLDPMWKLLNKEVDLGEPTSFLDHVYLGCTQRHCEVSKNTVDNYRTMFESRISAG